MTSVYAGFWKRFGAAIIDYVILVAGSALLGWAAGYLYGQAVASLDEKTAEGIGGIVGIIVWWLYYASLESSTRQATLGKQALGIKVVDRQGGRISFGRATGRHFAKIVSGAILMIGYLMAGFTARKQALHDMMAGGLVVNRDASAEQVGQAAPAARLPVWAIVLIVLGVSVFPLALVAAVAIPAYSDFTLRARVATAVVAGEAATRKVGDFYLRNKTLPRDLKEAGVTDPVSRGVRSMSVNPQDGSVRVVLAAPSLDGKSILFVARRKGDTRMVWPCRSEDVPKKYLPARCRN